MAYEGLRAALASDPEGVRAVFLAMREIRVRAPRAAQSPPVWAEAAHKIEFESGWRPDATNPFKDKKGESATGLLQWMPATARGMNTSVSEIKAMSRAEQAPLAARYWGNVTRHYKGLSRPGDMYIVGGYPAALALPEEHVIAEPGSAIWVQNPAWRDKTAGGAVTVRRLLEIGQPPPVPADLEIQLRALVPELDSLGTVVAGAAPGPAPAPGKTAPPPLPPSPTSGAIVPAPTVPTTPPPPSTRPATAKGSSGGWETLLALLALGAYFLRRSCL